MANQIGNIGASPFAFKATSPFTPNNNVSTASNNLKFFNFTPQRESAKPFGSSVKANID